MTPRTAFVLGLYLLAIYMLFSALAALPVSINWVLFYSQHVSWRGSTKAEEIYSIVIAILDPIVRLLLGILLFKLAPRIAKRAYPVDAPPAEAGGLTPRVLLRIGLTLIGVYVLFMALGPVFQALQLIFSGRFSGLWMNASDWRIIENALGHITFGIVLTIGAGRFSGFLLRLDPRESQELGKTNGLGLSSPSQPRSDNP